MTPNSLRGGGLFTEGRWRKQSVAGVLALSLNTHIKRHPSVESAGCLGLGDNWQPQATGGDAQAQGQEAAFSALPLASEPPFFSFTLLSLPRSPHSWSCAWALGAVLLPLVIPEHCRRGRDHFEPREPSPSE